jgi:hypothetical protein
METASDKSAPAARICSITLSEPTDPRSKGLRLSICLNAQSSILRLEKFHDSIDVYMLLRACASVSQFCKVSHKDAAVDGSNLRTLIAYMTRRSQVSFVVLAGKSY